MRSKRDKKREDVLHSGKGMAAALLTVIRIHRLAVEKKRPLTLRDSRDILDVCHACYNSADELLALVEEYTSGGSDNGR